MFCKSFALLSVKYRHMRVDKHRDKLLVRPMDKFWMAHIVAEYSSLVPPEGVDKFAFVVGSLIDMGLVDLNDIDPLVKVQLLPTSPVPATPTKIMYTLSVYKTY